VSDRPNRHLRGGLSYSKHSDEGKANKKMKRIHVVGLALCAVFAYGALAATSAFAAEWLVGGLAFAGELATNTEGTLTLLVLSGATDINTVACSGLFEGDVGNAAGKEINLVLDLFSLGTTQVLVEELTVLGVEGKSLACEALENPVGAACEVGLETVLWVEELQLPVNGNTELTWESLLELMVAGAEEFLDHFHHVAFELLCLTSTGLATEVLCEGLTSAVVTNLAGGVDITFNSASESLGCFEGTTEVFQTDLEGELSSVLTGGGVLSASE
jgi:hypothetical protein